MADEGSAFGMLLVGLELWRKGVFNEEFTCLDKPG